MAVTCAGPLVCFVRPTLSKSASFPTKVGEAWAAGLPVVVNPGIGDLDAMVEQSSTGVVMRGFDSGCYEEAVGQLALLLAIPPWAADAGIRGTAAQPHRWRSQLS